MDVIKCRSDPFSPINVARRCLHMAKYNWKEANRGLYDKSKAAKEFNYARSKLGRILYGRTYRYTPHLETTIAGIPCAIHVTHYTPGIPWRQHHFPGAGTGDCDPPEPEECEWIVLDRNGYAAAWLESKLTGDDIDRINCMVRDGYRR